jgi:hypothetical protein
MSEAQCIDEGYVTHRDPAQIREQLLRGLVSIADLAKALNIDKKTVYSLDWPFIQIGARRYYDIEKARETFMAKPSYTREMPPPRQRGRPRKIQLASVR